MFGKRCTLCGGNLDSNNICKECGLNNNLSEKNYKINHSNCDDKPLTHVHEEVKKKPIASKYDKLKKGKRTRKIVFIIVLLSIIGYIVGILASIGSAIFSESESYEETNPYEILEEEGYERPADGNEASIELTSGKYIVGVHIPEGDYEAEVQDDFDVVKVQDYEHSIYLYEYAGKEEENYLDDLRLFNGACVEIIAEDTVTLATEAAGDLEYEENPLTESFELSGNDRKTAGVDFGPGVYDFCAIRSGGNVEIEIYDTEEDLEEAYAIESFDIGESINGGIEYKNVILPKGATIKMEDYSEEDSEKFTILLTPSERIMSTDYLQTYIAYYY
ncbi:MAG: hypothetical protein ACI4D9_09785 [Lachnospiraceae bacterium]